MVRRITPADRTEYFKMTREFYQSDAVLAPVPDLNIERTFEELMTSDTYAEGYILEYEGEAAGFAILSKTFTLEAGGMVLWIEDFYVRPAYRNRGLGKEFFAYLDENIPEDIRRVRLEVEADNERAMSLYRKMDFTDLPYVQMVRELPE